MTKIVPKYLPEDFATEPKESAEAAHRHRLAQARAVLEAPTVVVDGREVRKVKLDDGTYAYIPLDLGE